MRKILIGLIIILFTCNCSFSQDDESFAGISYTVIPASHPVFKNDKVFENTKIGSEEFDCFINYGDTLSKKSLWFTSFDYCSIKSNNQLNDSTLKLLSAETPDAFTRIPQEQFYAWSAGLIYSFNEKYSLIYMNSLTLTDVAFSGKHTKSFNLDGMVCADRTFENTSSVGLGFYLNSNFKKTAAFPVLAVDLNVKKWSVSSSLPLQLNVDYNFTKRFSCGVGSELSMYYFDIAEKEKKEKSYMMHTILKMGANVEYKFKYVALYSGIGLAYQEYSYNAHSKTKFTLPESPYLTIGLRLIDN